MRPLLSIVIPYHNDSTELPRLIKSIFLSIKIPTIEIIIVDDGSKNKLILKLKKLQLLITYKESDKSYILTIPKKLKNKFNIRVINQQNKGPAAARNIGAKKAKGKFIVFLDSDVEVFNNTLYNLSQIYLNDPDVVALTGVWAKEQRSNSFFPNFKALRDWSYWINERDKSGYYYLFSTRIASIKKSVFVRLGGFDESYNAALVEDIELTYRIARRYAIIFAPNVRVKHEFESFWPIAKKYFLRAYHWTKLYEKRKKFDPVATTLQEALTSLSGVGLVFTGLICLAQIPTLPAVFSTISNISLVSYHLSLLFYYLFILFLILHIFLTRKFLKFLYDEKGTVFAIKAF